MSLRAFGFQEKSTVFFGIDSRFKNSRFHHVNDCTIFFSTKLYHVEMNDNLSLSPSPLYVVAECFRGICCARELRSTRSFPQTEYASCFHDSLRFSDVFTLLRISRARVHVYFFIEFPNGVFSPSEVIGSH